MTKIILDTDIGSEMTDAAALILAAISPEIELLGITTVTHDSVFRATVAKKFLNLLGKNNISVSAGFGTNGEHIWEKEIIFPMGYSPSEDLDSRPAYKLILDLVNKNPNEIMLVSIGTTTNIAKALEEDPELPIKVSGLILMGGMMEPPMVGGKAIPRGFEYNFCNDSASTEKIIKAGFNLTLLPGDLTFQQDNPWTLEELARLGSIKNKAVELLMKLKDRSLIAIREGMSKANLPVEFSKPWVNDEFVISYLIEPKLFNTKDIFIKWELPDKYPRLIPSESGYQVKIIDGTDFKKAKEFIITRLAGI